MKPLIIYHSDQSGATNSILKLAKENYSFAKLPKFQAGYFKLIPFYWILFLKLIFRKKVILNGLAVISNPKIIYLLPLLKSKDIFIYWHEAEYHWNETRINQNHIGSLNDLINEATHLVDSKIVKEWLIDKFKISKSKIEVIYECIDQKKIQLKSKENKNVQNQDIDQFCIVIIGSVCIRKGINEVLKLLSKLSRKFKILWIGKYVEFSDKQKLEFKSINKNPEKGSIEFFGHKKNPYPFIKKANIVLIPSIDEPFGIVGLEALALGKFIVTNKSVGFSEIITKDERLGFIYKDIIDLAKFLNNIDEKITNKHIKMRKDKAFEYDISNFEKRFDNILNQ